MFLVLALLGLYLVEGEGSTQCDVRVQRLSEVPDILSSAQYSESSDFHLCFETGRTYFLEGQPLQLTSAHNHNKGGRVIWKTAHSNSHGGNEAKGVGEPMPPAVISGGAPLQKWQKCNENGHCPGWEGVWVHFVSDIPNITANMLPVRQLWVDGLRVTRVAVAGSSLGWKTTSTGYSAPSPAPASYVTDKVELRWPRVVRNWIEPRCVVTAVNGNEITIDPACWKDLNSRNNNHLPPVPTYVENIGGPPGPGEFYADNQYIFYRPATSTASAPPENAFVPTQEHLLVAENLNKHSFQNLKFAHATWRIATSPGGYVPSQTLVSTKGEPLGAVQLDKSVDVDVSGCSFENIGAAYALSVGLASQQINISSNTFTDLSGGAIKIGNVDNTRALVTNQSEWDVSYTVARNLMKNVSVEFHGGACVFAGYVAKTIISHNTIQNTGYTGISLGWGWGTHVKGPQTFAADNHIDGNRLEGVMSYLNDGGCTYTLGPQPRSSVTNNYCSSDKAPVVGCFYHDNGSRYFTTQFNVCTTSPAPCVYLQGCCNSPAYDIAVSDLWCRDTAPVRNGCAAENCTIDSKTLYILKAGQPWPADAQKIVDGSGI